MDNGINHLNINFNKNKLEDSVILNNYLPCVYTEENKNKVRELVCGDLDILNITNNLEKIKYFFNFVDVFKELEKECSFLGYNTINELSNKINNLDNKDKEDEYIKKIIENIKFFNENKSKFEDIKLKILNFLNKGKYYYEKIGIDIKSKKQESKLSESIELILSGRIKEGTDKILENEEINEFDLRVLSITASSEALKIFKQKGELIEKYSDIYEYIIDNIKFSTIIELIGASNGVKNMSDEKKVDSFSSYHYVAGGIREIISYLDLSFLSTNKNLVISSNTNEKNILKEIYSEFLDKFNILALDDEQIKNLTNLGISNKLEGIFKELQNEKNLKPRHGEILALLINNGVIEI